MSYFQIYLKFCYLCKMVEDIWVKNIHKCIKLSNYLEMPKKGKGLKRSLDHHHFGR
jgi:hypothetical protein